MDVSTDFVAVGGSTADGHEIPCSAERLSRIFDGEAPVIAVDLPDLVDWLNDAGIPAIPLNEIDSLADGAVVAVNANPDTVGLALRSQPGVRKIHVVQSVHNGDEHTVRYTVEKLLASDPLSCVQRQGDIAVAIKSSGGHISFTGEGTDLAVRSRGQAGLIHLDDPTIKPGECLSAHSFFEIGLANLKADHDSAFLVDGHCRAIGMIASRDPQLRAGPEPAEWVEHRREISRKGVELHIKDNQLVRCLLDGRDIKDDIARWTRDYGLRITECSIGTNPQVLAGADWSLNSLMNEGAQGIHVGFGRPIDGIHFDFICPAVALVAG
ncbi:hypothetical protein MGAST_09735 [Mycobacterium gastri 'Wayne']|uniref:Crocagin biosynthetic protein CgnE/B domain-containing protein n=1 Tax=Mycobacterium gastri TaxID=1777 RepID=A0A1X1UU76_MYCGS|nr:hypothetical protein MGAST_09735 [Mycobacterium gastri 'Wayne']ORV60384.1 hypothetical protein AWC07_18425 [Mycobacterium gastri]